MRRWIAIITFAGAATLASQQSRAFFYCNEPSEPSCVDGNGFFDDQSDFDNCKSEVESYINDVKEFSQCLIDANEAALKSSGEIVEKFNCRAEGRSYC